MVLDRGLVMYDVACAAVLQASFAVLSIAQVGIRDTCQAPCNTAKA